MQSSSRPGNLGPFLVDQYLDTYSKISSEEFKILQTPLPLQSGFDSCLKRNLLEGQTISKKNYGVLNSSKKLNKTHYPD